MSGGWSVAQSHGDAGAFHAHEPAPERRATFHTVERATLVLGSAQRADAVDQRVASALGVDVVTRRSGGSAVLLLPGEFVWLDLVVPAGDPLWCDDVGAAMLWVGELWHSALASIGAIGEVHRGGLVAGEWSRQVCFAGAGTGEVLRGSAKMVGISQRRTRDWARFQSMCHLRWRPELTAALVASPRPSPAELAPLVATVSAAGADVRAALIAHLP